MTRDQFDARFAATQENTEGYTDAQLAAINDAVFALIADGDAHEVDKSLVDHMFRRAFIDADHTR